MLMFYLAMLETEEQQSKFETIYTHYRGLMVHSAFQVLKDSQRAEDVVHDVCLKLIKNIDKIRMENCNQLRSFLVHITRNQAIDYIRVHNKEYAQEDPAFGQDDAHTPSAEDMVLGANAAQKAVLLVQELEEVYRAPLRLQIDGYSVGEIAAFLGITESNVKVRIHRGREKIRKQMLEGEETSGEQHSIL